MLNELRVLSFVLFQLTVSNRVFYEPASYLVVSLGSQCLGFLSQQLSW